MSGGSCDQETSFWITHVRVLYLRFRGASGGSDHRSVPNIDRLVLPAIYSIWMVLLRAVPRYLHLRHRRNVGDLRACGRPCRDMSTVSCGSSRTPHQLGHGQHLHSPGRRENPRTLRWTDTRQNMEQSMAVHSERVSDWTLRPQLEFDIRSAGVRRKR